MHAEGVGYMGTADMTEPVGQIGDQCLARATSWRVWWETVLRWSRAVGRDAVDSHAKGAFTGLLLQEQTGAAMVAKQGGWRGRNASYISGNASQAWEQGSCARHPWNNDGPLSV